MILMNFLNKIIILFESNFNVLINAVIYISYKEIFMLFTFKNNQFRILQIEVCKTYFIENKKNMNEKVLFYTFLIFHTISFINFKL